MKKFWSRVKKVGARYVVVLPAVLISCLAIMLIDSSVAVRNQLAASAIDQPTALYQSIKTSDEQADLSVLMKIVPEKPKPKPVAKAPVIEVPKTDCQQVACLALTFDDGPNPITTPQILDELAQAHVPATFFVVGSRVPGNEALLQRMHAEGSEIGNHSWNHPDLTKLPPDQIKQQFDLTQAAVVASGVPAPIVFRPPYGTVNQAVQDVIPMSLLMWNEDPHDWAANTPGQVVQAVEASAKPGAIIDIHDIYHVTANALPQILVDLSARGYHFVTVSQLLDLTANSRGLYYGHP